MVADTHVGGQLPRLPREVAEVLSGVDLVIHAGDMTSPGVLDDLRAVAPLVAVRGNHDNRVGVRHLPRSVVIRAGGLSIGVAHGHRRLPVELASITASLVVGRQRLMGFDRTMRRRFGAVDCVVVGHLHQPVRRWVEGALLFSPGAVYVPEADPVYRWKGARGRVYGRYRRGLPPEAWRPAVGMIEIADGRLSARSIPLRRAIRAVA